MKKIIAWMLTIVLLVTSVAILIPLYSAYAANDYSIIKVRIANGTPASQSIKVIGHFVMEEDKSFAIAAGSATIRNTGGSLTISSGGKSKTVGSTLTLLNGDTNSKANRIEMKGYHSTNQYLGDMIFQASGSGVLATNRLPLEQYVLGVIAMEMGGSFNLEALKAQAVASRSYAVTYMAKRKNNAYHILDGPSEQAYIGYSSNAKLNQAVSETAGQLMMYNGKVIEAFYSAANGGQTDVAGNSWGGGDAKDATYPYFQIYDDPYDLKMGASKKLEEKVFIAKNLKGNQAATNSALWGDIMEQFGLARGVSESSLSGAVINSVSYTRQFPRTSESRSYTGVTFNVTVNGATKNVYIDLAKLKTRGIFTNGNLRMKSCEEGTKDGVTGWYLTNRRFGHGVGLSQWGAQEMSNQGKGYREILNFYYRGVTLNTEDTGAGWTNEGEGTGMIDNEGNKVYGWYEYEGGTYYLDPATGVMAKGWKKIDDGTGAMRWYYFSNSGARLYGWQKVNGVWYYMNPGSGIMLMNEAATIDGKVYAFNNSGAMQANRWYRAGGEWYYLNSNGAAHKGWKQLGGVWYFMDRDTAKMYTGVQSIDGKVYVFASSGAMQANNWSKNGNDWYYLSASGAAMKGWHKDKGVWYFLDKTTAKMYTGAQVIDGEVYSFRPSGSMMANGWGRQGSTWYYLKSSGAAVKGWRKVDGNGGAKWYYMNPADAKMMTGSIEEGGNVYLLTSSGAMLANGWQSFEGNRYYLKSNGAAYKGWNSIENKQYYFDPVTAIMATGEKEIDGQIYVFDRDGLVVEQRPRVDEAAVGEDAAIYDAAAEQGAEPRVDTPAGEQPADDQPADQPAEGTMADAGAEQ